VKRQTLKSGRNVVVLRGELRRVRHHVDLHARAASGVRGGFSAIMRIARPNGRLGPSGHRATRTTPLRVRPAVINPQAHFATPTPAARTPGASPIRRRPSQVSG
jgi:hypothetical protein